MPKVKTHSGAKKRFNLTKSGKVKSFRRVYFISFSDFNLYRLVVTKLRLKPKLVCLRLGRTK